MAHYVYWLGQDGNLWVNQNGNTFNIGAPHGDYWKNGYAEGAKMSMADRGTLIDDPNPGNPQAANTTSDDVYYGGSGSGGSSSRSSGGSYSTYNAEEEARKANMRNLYDRQINDINSNLDSMDRQLENSLAGVRGEYDTYKNEQQSAYDANKNDYDKSTLQNMQNLQSNRNDITNRASNGLRGLLRVLGAMGAGGGSVARYEAPNMVTAQANQEYNNAGKTYAQNQSNLDTDWGNYKNQFENDRKKLEDWYNGQVKAKQQENYEKRQSLLSDLVSAYTNRAQYGGDYNGNINSTYDRIADFRNKINDLGQYAKPNYTGKTAVYNAPDLAAYNANNTDLTTSVEESDTGATSQLLTALRGLNKKKDNNPYGV